MNDVKQIIEWFKNLPKIRQIQFAGLLSGIAFLTTILIYWFMSPSYAVLFNHLDTQDANQILRRLEQEKIPYQLSHDSSEITVPSDLINATRIKLMSTGMQLNGNVGFELFDKNDFGMTDFSQKINFQRALQGELERTITSLDEIRQARVHLVIPEQRLFSSEANPPKAAINLHLKKNLTKAQVLGIQKLVAASVSHLDLKNVVIVDQQGRTLTSYEDNHSENHFTTKKSVERHLTQKVTEMLHKVFNEEEVMVQVDASLNYDELQRELIKPQSHGVVSHEKEIKHSTPINTKKAKDKTDLTLERFYELGSEKELFKRASGSIERLSVSVILPEDCDQQTLVRVEHMVKNIIGFNPDRGDSISVEALIEHHLTPFNNTEITMPSPMAKTQYLNLNALYLLITLALLLSVPSYFLIRRKQHQQRELILLELRQWLNQHD